MTTWLPVHPEYADGVNVADEVADPQSVLYFYKMLIALRKNIPALLRGTYAPLDVKNEAVFAFTRQLDAQTCVVILNFSGDSQAITLALLIAVIFSTDVPNEEILYGTYTVAPYSVIIAMRK